jgi:hypothetical protein
MKLTQLSSLHLKVNSCWVNEEIPRFLWNPKVHNRVHKSLSPITILSEPHESSPQLSAYFLKTLLILSSHLRLSLPRGLFPSEFSTKMFHTFFITLSNTVTQVQAIEKRPILLGTIKLNCHLSSLWSVILFHLFYLTLPSMSEKKKLRMISLMDNELERVRKGTVLTSVKVLSRHLLGGTEENCSVSPLPSQNNQSPSRDLNPGRPVYVTLYSV